MTDDELIARLFPKEHFYPLSDNDKRKILEIRARWSKLIKLKEPNMKQLKLYDLKRDQKFRIIDVVDCPVITFVKPDGMYSVCTVEVDGAAVVTHVSMGAPVEVVDDTPSTSAA